MTDMEDLKYVADDILSGEILDPDIIVDILTKAGDQYHNTDNSFLTDNEYDSIEQILKSIDPHNPYLEQVGSEVRGGKIDLPVPLGSLDKLEPGDAERWVISNGLKDHYFVLSDKEDGVSGLKIYGKGGVFQKSYSRGNGFQGADTTRHVKNIKGFVPKAPVPCQIRIEIIMEDEVFDLINAAHVAAGNEPFKNARNYVAGCMNASESSEIFYQNVRIVGTSVISPKMSKLEQIKFMEDMGLLVPGYLRIEGRKINDDMLTKHLLERKQKSKFALDGLVIDIDDLSTRESLVRDSDSINPTYSKKFKLIAPSTTATVVKVHYEASKAGYLKPRIEIKPTDIGGVTVTYATGFNASFIRKNGIGPGAVIELIRSGDVIPYVKKVITPTTPQLPLESQYGKMAWTVNSNGTEVDLYIVNPEENDEVQINIMRAFFADLDVPGLKDGNIDKLFNYGKKNIVDIIKMPEAELKNVLGNSAGSNVYNGIKHRLNPISMVTLMGCSQKMGRGFGIRKAKKLLEKLTIDQFTYQAIFEVKGFGHETAKSVMDNLPIFRKFLKDIEGYFTLQEDTIRVTSNKLQGKIFVFTLYRDKKAEEKIVELGGIVGSSVNSKTNYVVTNEPDGTKSKLVKARELKIPIIGPAELAKILEN